MAARRRSFWGWGYEDRFPAASERIGLGRMASALLGGAALSPGEPPELEAIRLPEPRLEPPPELARFATTDRFARASHTYGKSYRDLARGFAGDFSAAPDLVAYPESEVDVERALAWCERAGVAAIPFGGGTSVVGGVEADVGDGFAGALSLDLGKLGGVREIDEVSRAARIGAGALGPALESELGERGFTLRCFPQSFEFSTLGGWIATRAGGHFATLYTHIDDLVESTRAITPRGLWQTRRLPASGAGPSPDRLMIGSEGALGVITEAWVRIRPRPRYRSSASLGFREWAAAVAAVRELAQSGLHPASCRLLDSREALIHQVAADGRHILLIGFESAAIPTDGAIAAAVAIARGAGGELRGEITTADAGERIESGGAASDWRRSFIDTPYLFGALVSLGLVVDTFETACTWDRFEGLHEAVREAAFAAFRAGGGAGLLSCRFTHVYPDGPAPYYTFITTAPAGGELETHARVKTAVSDALIAAGGTITHHHAVGRAHMPWYRQQRTEPFARALAAVKAELDPAGVLNPGVLVP
jgi:alkyldihydroxyacetonephosphate synthase